jgi:hypothetical protein
MATDRTNAKFLPLTGQLAANHLQALTYVIPVTNTHVINQNAINS